MAQQSEIDTKRYDRQIRLWGLDTQRGLVGARILVLGVNGLANEIAKNLVLAGVGHVRFQDPGCVTAADLEAGGLFSVSEAQLGVGRAEAIAATLKAMNPSVELTYSCAAVAELSAELLQTYHFIVGTRGVEAVREITACTALLERHGGGENADPQSRVEPPAPKRHRANGDSGPALARSNGTHEVVPMRPTDAPPLPKFLAAVRAPPPPPPPPPPPWKSMLRSTSAARARRAASCAPLRAALRACTHRACAPPRARSGGARSAPSSRLPAS
jgi:hypothetical protein